MTITNKDRVLNQIVAARWRYGCWHAIPEKGHLKAWRTAQLATVRVAMSKGCRSTTVYHALAFKPHKVDPVMARLWELIRLLGRSEDWWDELCYYLNTEHPPLGPVSCCAYLLRQMGFIPDIKWCLRDHIGIIHLRQPREEAQVSGWAHAWRTRMRNYLIGRHNGHRTDLHGCLHVNTSSAKMMLSKLSGNDQLLMEQILAGGLATEERKARWTKKAPHPCERCKQEADTAEHRWWKCPCWQHYRIHAPAFREEWPNCFKHCGLPTEDMQMDTSTLAVVHTMMLNIQKQLNFLENRAKETEADLVGRGNYPDSMLGTAEMGLLWAVLGNTVGVRTMRMRAVAIATLTSLSS